MSQEQQTNATSDIHDWLATNLRHSMREKALSEAELCRKTGIPQTTLHKILSGQTSDPRASTLKLLAAFFSTSIDALLSDPGNPQNNHLSKLDVQTIPIISWNDCIKTPSLVLTLNTHNWSHWAISSPLSPLAYVLISKPAMEPRFSRGTQLFIDPEITAKDGDIVVVLYPNTQEATLRYLSSDGPHKLLTTVAPPETATTYVPEIKILGVVRKTGFSFE